MLIVPPAAAYSIQPNHPNFIVESSQQDEIRMASVLHVSTLADNVYAQDLYSGLLPRGGAWNEHHQCSIHTVTTVNK